MKEISVITKQGQYPVIIGSNIYKQLPIYLDKYDIYRNSKILIITDSNVAPLYLKKLIEVLKGYELVYYIIDAGEDSKSLKVTEKLINFAIKQGLNRSSTIIALGGGVVGDLAGFVAAIYLRGIKFIQVPTTILAHDSSVGGKVGINHSLGKNLVGAFYHPKFVFFDTSFLLSLSKREIKSGLAEVIKHGLIADKAFTYWLDDNSNNLLNYNLDAINEAIYRGIQIKAKVVGEDEAEQGIRAILNYGHTLAHAIETISQFKYSHGEAVAIGMIFACKIALKLGKTSDNVINYTRELMAKFELPLSFSNDTNPNKIMDVLMRDKKFINGKIRMVLPIEIGRVTIFENIDKKLVSEALEEYIRAN